jgi:hypothetical protein
MGGDVKPAIEAIGSSGPVLTVANSILLQAQPPSPDVKEFALTTSGTRVVVRSSTVAGFESGIRATGSGGALTIDRSSVLTPAPTNTGLSVGVRAAVETIEPTVISDSRLVGIAGLLDQDASAAVVRTVIEASGGGAGLIDHGGAGTLTLRDSVVDVVGNPTAGAGGVGLDSLSNSDPVAPTLSLVGDTVFVRSAKKPRRARRVDRRRRLPRQRPQHDPARRRHERRQRQ